MITKFALRMMLLAMPLLLLAACSDDPVTPDPEPEPEREWVTERHTIWSSDYINNRFFQLDLPEEEVNGRAPGETINLASLQVFMLIGPGEPAPGEVLNIAAYVDSTGFRDWDGADTTEPFVSGYRWRRLWDIDAMLDGDGRLLNIDLNQDLGGCCVLACSYEIVDAEWFVVARVGDNPHVTPPSTQIIGSEELHYRMKLLKAAANNPDPHVFRYIRRNIYSLSFANISPELFDLSIWSPYLQQGAREMDEQGVDYIQVFGLDRENQRGEPGPDGVVDYHDRNLFDLQHGLLIFPMDNPQPFAATREQYEENVLEEGWEWDPDSYLAQNLAWQLYDPSTIPLDYDQYGYFFISVQHAFWPWPGDPPK